MPRTRLPGCMKSAGRRWQGSPRRDFRPRVRKIGGTPTSRPIAAVPFRARHHAPCPLLSEEGSCGFSQHPLADLGCPKLVFINGRFAKQLSTLEALPKGVQAGSLAEALASDAKTLERHLARYAADYREHAFVALNTAFLEDGAFIEIPKGVVLEKPIYLLYVSDPSGLPTVSYPRNLIVAGRESQATIIEAYVGEGAASGAPAPPIGSLLHQRGKRSRGG